MIREFIKALEERMTELEQAKIETDSRMLNFEKDN